MSRIERVFDARGSETCPSMTSLERSGPGFIALQAATLGIDDLSRCALRALAETVGL